MRRYLLIAAVIFIWALCSLPASAADVMLGGTTVFRLEKSEDAAIISQRIENLLQDGARAEDIHVEKEDKNFVIYWGKVQVITVTPELAKMNKSEPDALAALWVSNMKAVASIGLLNLDCEKAVIAVGAEKIVNASGLAKGELKVSEPTGRTEIYVDSDNGIITIWGKSIGKAKITVTKGKGKCVVWVHVKDKAGSLPREVEVEVTGSPALSSAVAQASLLAIASNTAVNPGCSVYIDESGFNPMAVPSGDTMRMMVPVGINPGEDYFAVRGEVAVNVVNIPVEQDEQNLLMVSNRPERVSQDGILLNYTFSRKEPSRLMYSHMNDSSKHRNLWVNLSNLTEEPLKIVINWTSAGPEKSEIHVGQTSAKRYLESVAAKSGYIVTLPPMSALELAAHDMKPQALVTGFITFKILEGEKATVEVRTALAPSYNDGSDLPDIGAPFNPFKIHPHGVFAQPYFENDAEYTVGGASVAFKYGESPWLIDFETGLPNTGNFGVLYKTLLELKNPDNAKRRVGLYFKPLSGPAGANFLIDGHVFTAPFRKIGDEVLVANIELAPKSTSMVEVITFPEASSCYPAQFELRDIH